MKWLVISLAMSAVAGASGCWRPYYGHNYAPPAYAQQAPRLSAARAGDAGRSRDAGGASHAAAGLPAAAVLPTLLLALVVCRR